MLPTLELYSLFSRGTKEFLSVFVLHLGSSSQSQYEQYGILQYCLTCKYIAFKENADITGWHGGVDVRTGASQQEGPWFCPSLTTWGPYVRSVPVWVLPEYSCRLCLLVAHMCQCE